MLFVCDSRGILLNLPPGMDNTVPRPIFHVTACQRSLFPLHHFINIRRIPATTFMTIKTTFVKFKPGQVNDKYMSKPVELGGLYYRKKQRCKFSELTSST